MKCLRSLYGACDNHALLPKSLVIPISYNRTEVPLASSSVADVWKGSSDDQEVAVKVPRITAVNRSEEIRSVGCRLCSLPATCVDNLSVVGIVDLQGRDVEGASSPKCVDTARSDGNRTSVRDGVRVDGEW